MPKVSGGGFAKGYALAVIVVAQIWQKGGAHLISHLSFRTTITTYVGVNQSMATMIHKLKYLHTKVTHKNQSRT